MGGGRSCTKCGVTKPDTEFFKDSRNKSGLRSSCKDCDKARGKAHYAANRKKRLAWQKNYYRAHQEEAVGYARQWRKDNPEKTREYHRLFAERYPEKECKRHRLKGRIYYKKNPEKAKAASRAWGAKNPEKVALKNSRRRAKTSEFEVREKDIARIYAQPCAACGTKERITLDHIVPLARGGKHSVGNFQPLCHSCNCSKGAKLMTEWMMVK